MSGFSDLLLSEERLSVMLACELVRGMTKKVFLEEILVFLTQVTSENTQYPYRYRHCFYEGSACKDVYLLAEETRIYKGEDTYIAIFYTRRALHRGTVSIGYVGEPSFTIRFDKTARLQKGDSMRKVKAYFTTIQTLYENE